MRGRSPSTREVVLLAGAFGSTISIGGTTLNTAGMSDVFFARMSSNDDVLAVTALGGADSEGDVVVTASGSTAIIVGTTKSNELVFPNGRTLKKVGLLDGYVLQQP
jgi:hypothetical protein